MLLEEPETPMWCKLCVADHEKGKIDGGVPVCENSPRQVLQHAVVFILPSAVVIVEEHHLLAQPMSLEEIVETTHNVVSRTLLLRQCGKSLAVVRPRSSHQTQCTFLV